MSECGDRTENWRGSYDGWLSHDRRNVDPVGAPREVTCSICGARPVKQYLPLTCHTAQERDAAYRARMGW